MSDDLTVNKFLSQVPRGPLNGVVVACLGSQICGSWTSEQLARKGAIVIKIERPDTGDPKRKNSPATAFNQFNAGKLSARFEKTTEGKQHRLAVINAAHVIVDNRSNDAKRRDDVLKAVLDNKHRIHPIIYCGISGYGSGDERKAYDRSLQAAVGMADINGGLVPFPVVDMCAGTEAAKLILEQLFYVERTQAAERHKMGPIRIDIAMVNVAMSLMSNMAAIHYDTGKMQSSIVPFGLFDTKTRKIGLATARDEQFQVLCNLLGLEDLAKNFSTNELRLENRKQVEDRIQAVLWTKTAEQWSELFSERDLPAEPVQTFTEALERYGAGMFVKDAAGGTYMRSPGRVTYSGESVDNPPLLPAPGFGEHNGLVQNFIESVGAVNFDSGAIRQMLQQAPVSVSEEERLAMA